MTAQHKMILAVGIRKHHRMHIGACHSHTLMTNLFHNSCIFKLGYCVAEAELPGVKLYQMMRLS